MNVLCSLLHKIHQHTPPVPPSQSRGFVVAQHSWAGADEAQPKQLPSTKMHAILTGVSMGHIQTVSFEETPGKGKCKAAVLIS